MGNSWTDKFGARFSILLFAVASLGAVVAGSIVIAAADKTSAFWLRDLMAWAAGALLATAIVSVGFSRPVKLTLLFLAVAGLVFSLINHGTMGVHRWLDLGPLHINVAGLLLPALLVALAANNSNLRTSLAAGVIVILCLQPDASQASAFAAAFLVLQGGASTRSIGQRVAAIAILACAALSWMRPVSLPAIPEVEGVMGLAWRYSPMLATVAIGCLMIAAISPLLLSIGNPGIRRAAFGLSTYFALTTLAPFVAPYPVPLIGAGMSAIAGFWLGFGCLIAFRRKSSSLMPFRQPAENDAPNPITPDRNDLVLV